MDNLPDEDPELTREERRRLRECLLPALASIQHFDFEMLLKARPPVQFVACNLIEVYEGRTELSSESPFVRWQTKRIKGDPNAVEVINEAERIFSEWKKGPSLRTKDRKHALLKIWHGLGSPKDMSRDDLWNRFCEERPELLEGVQDERKIKFLTFKAAHLDFLPTNPGGRPKRR